MDDDPRVVLAVWTLLVVPFVGLAAFLATRGELTAFVVATYWFPPAVLTAIGTIPPPWRLLGW